MRALVFVDLAVKDEKHNISLHKRLHSGTVCVFVPSSDPLPSQPRLSSCLLSSLFCSLPTCCSMEFSSQVVGASTRCHSGWTWWSLFAYFPCVTGLLAAMSTVWLTRALSSILLCVDYNMWQDVCQWDHNTLAFANFLHDWMCSWFSLMDHSAINLCWQLQGASIWYSHQIFSTRAEKYSSRLIWGSLRNLIHLWSKQECGTFRHFPLHLVHLNQTQTEPNVSFIRKSRSSKETWSSPLFHHCGVPEVAAHFSSLKHFCLHQLILTLTCLPLSAQQPRINKLYTVTSVASAS